MAYNEDDELVHKKPSRKLFDIASGLRDFSVGCDNSVDTNMICDFADRIECMAREILDNSVDHCNGVNCERKDLGAEPLDECEHCEESEVAK